MEAFYLTPASFHFSTFAGNLNIFSNFPGGTHWTSMEPGFSEE